MFYLDIIDQFSKIEDVIVQKDHANDGWCVRTRGSKDGNFHDNYSTYKHKAVAKAVAEKISYFIGV